MDASYFAYTQYKDYLIYKALAERETDSEFKRILEELMDHEWEDFVFWKEYTKQEEFSVSPLVITGFVLLRRVLGLTFTAKFLEGREHAMVARYHAYLETIEDERLHEEIHNIIKHERYHEEQLIEQVQEERVAFMSSIILGMNDGLIELTGALIGFSFALQNHLLVALTGLITGVSASFSMAASAYMQARHEEEGKNPWKAAAYTGISYFVVVTLLVSPFFILTNELLAAAAMFAIVVAIIASVSFYSSVLFSRKFSVQFGEMLAASVGVALLAFALGTGFRILTGIGV